MADVVVIKWQDVEGLPEGARVQTNKQTGTTSAFFPYYFRDEKGEPKQERDYIGSVVDGKFEPNLYYFKNHPTRENRPLENWKDPGQRAKAEAALAINKKVEKVEASPSHKYELDETTKEDQIRQVGATALCMNILRRIGMVEDIARTLNYDPVLVMHVINLAIFYALTAKATYLASSEANVAKFIGAGCLTSQRASELFTRIGGNLDLSTRFNKTRIARLVASGDLLAIDGTFMDCNSSKISVAKKGKRKNGTFGPQINFSLMANVSQGYPLGYRYYSGDTNDVTTLDDLIQLWIDAGLNKKNVELLIDRGYCATDRLKTLDSEGFKFVACAKTNLTWIKNAIMNRNSEFYSPLSQLLHHYCFGIQEKMPNSDSMKATIFFNPNKQMCETREMREDLEKVRKRCKEETISLEHPLMNFLKDPVLPKVPVCSSVQPLF